MTVRDKMNEFLAADIYGITASELSHGRGNAAVVNAMIEAGVKVIQYREKNMTPRDMYAECLVLREMTRMAGVLFIINDSIDLALAVAADGVHVGQDDLPVGVVRRLVGESMLVGLSTHNLNQVAQAEAEGFADYIGMGPVYATATKPDAAAVVGIDMVRCAATQTRLPVVAIGGITADNIAPVKEAGASLFAVVSSIVSSDDIGAAVRDIRSRLG